MNVCNKTLKLLCLIVLFPFSGNCQGYNEVCHSLWESWYADVLQPARQNTYADSPAQILEAIGDAYYGLGKYDSCAYFLSLAIAKDSNALTARGCLNMAAARIAMGKEGAGAAFLHKHLQPAAKDTAAAFFDELMGEHYLLRNDWDAAIHSFTNALGYPYAGIRIKASYYLACALLQRNKTGEAMRMLVTADTAYTSPMQYNFIYQSLARILFDSINASIHYRYADLLPSEPRWAMIETDKILFFFSDTAGWGRDSVDAYIHRCEQQYNAMHRQFHLILPRKLVLYVHNSEADISGRRNNLDVAAGAMHIAPQNAMPARSLCYWATADTSVAKMSDLTLECVAAAFGIDGNAVAGYGSFNGVPVHPRISVWDYYPGYHTIPIITNPEFSYFFFSDLKYYLCRMGTLTQLQMLLQRPCRENAEFIYGRQRVKNIADGYSAEMRKKMEVHSRPIMDGPVRPQRLRGFPD